MDVTISNRHLKIRPVSNHELDSIFEVYRQCEDFLALGPVALASREMVLQDLSTSEKLGGVFCGIYDAKGDMIGILDYVPSHFEGDPECASLELLMIAAPARKQGVGKAVVKALEKEILKNSRITTIRSGVQVNNPEAIKFWLSCGFHIISGPTLMPDQTTVFGLQKDF